MSRLKTGISSFDKFCGYRGTGIGKAVFISLLNQMVLSSTNFILGFYLVRVLSPDEFGLYGIGIAVSLLYVGVGNALFLTQMVVHTPDKIPAERENYAARILVGSVVFSIITVFLVIVTVMLWSLFSNWLWLHATLIFSVVAAATGAFLKEFVVRQAYTARVESRALAVNVANTITVITLLTTLHVKGCIATSWQVLLIYAVGQFTGTGCGVILAKLPCRGVSWNAVLADVREAFDGGRWALGGVSVTWVQTQAYTYVTALGIGPVGVGYANAARLMIAPLMFIMPALNQLTMPRLAELRTSNLRRMLNVGSIITLGLILLASLYSLILFCFGDLFANLLLGERYQEYQGILSLVGIWCLVMHMQIFRSGAGTLLQSLKHFRELMVSNVFSALVTVGSAFTLMKFMGISGAVLGVGLGELFLGAILWRLIWNVRKNSC